MVAPAPYRRGLWLAVAAFVLAGLASQSTARAQPSGAPPRGPRVIHAPTAWLQKSGDVYASAGANQRGGGFGEATVGLGTLAEVGLVLSDRVIVCDECRTSGDDAAVEHLFETGAVFRLGVGNGVLWRGPPAFALGFRRSFASRAIDGVRGDLAELYLVGSHSIGALDVHGGARLHGARVERESAPSRDLLAAGVFAGLQWRPARYPRTMLMADFSFAPELRPDAVDLRWLVGWGVRYQALSWGSIELGARHRQGEGFEDAAVLVRVNAAFR